MGNIMIHHECEGEIEISVLMIAFWHFEACQVMTNYDPEGWIFLSHPPTNNEYFFLFTIDFLNFRLRISFQKSLNRLRCTITR